LTNKCSKLYQKSRRYSSRLAYCHVSWDTLYLKIYLSLHIKQLNVSRVPLWIWQCHLCMKGHLEFTLTVPLISFKYWPARYSIPLVETINPFIQNPFRSNSYRTSAMFSSWRKNINLTGGFAKMKGCRIIPNLIFREHYIYYCVGLFRADWFIYFKTI